MPRFAWKTVIGGGLGALLVLAPLGLAACGNAPAGPRPEEPARTAILQRMERRSLVLFFQNPRTAFSTDKFELSTGKTVPADDGMSPEGDISFFFDGSRFQVIANSSGGATRTLAPGKLGQATEAFSMAPIPVQEGSEILFRGDHGEYLIRILRLDLGSMEFLRTGSGKGSGSVTFAYQRRFSVSKAAIGLTTGTLTRLL